MRLTGSQRDRLGGRVEVSVLLTAEEHDRLARLAAIRRQTMAATIREALAALPARSDD